MKLNTLVEVYIELAKAGIIDAQIATEHDTLYLCIGPELPAETITELNKLGFNWYDSDDSWIAFT